MTTQEKQNLISQFTTLLNSLTVDDKNFVSTVDKKVSGKPELLTIKECLQEVTGLTECTLRSLVTQGKISHIRTGAGKRGKILVNKVSLIKYFRGEI